MVAGGLPDDVCVLLLGADGCEGLPVFTGRGPHMSSSILFLNSSAAWRRCSFLLRKDTWKLSMVVRTCPPCDLAQSLL